MTAAGGGGPAEKWRRWLAVAMGVRQALTGEVLTQMDLAQRAGVSRQLVSQILSGTAEGVSVETLHKLATVLGTDPTDDDAQRVQWESLTAATAWLAQSAAYYDVQAIIQRRIAELDREMTAKLGGEGETLARETADDLEDAEAEFRALEPPKRSRAAEP